MRNEQKKYTCTTCHRKFKTRDELINHVCPEEYDVEEGNNE
jgi:predicted RNA-binding Zn-ribbon protein involved in translation (DUF1610 family)